MPQRLNFESKRFHDLQCSVFSLRRIFVRFLKPMKLIKLITVPGHLKDLKYHLTVPENLFLDHFLWFSAELFAYGGKSAVCMSLVGFEQFSN